MQKATRDKRIFEIAIVVVIIFAVVVVCLLNVYNAFVAAVVVVVIVIVIVVFYYTVNYVLFNSHKYNEAVDNCYNDGEWSIIWLTTVFVLNYLLYSHQ